MITILYQRGGAERSMSSAPVRMQLSRRKGFNLRALSHTVNGREPVNVARPSRWGNHVPIDRMVASIATAWDWGGVGGTLGDARWAAFFRDRDEAGREAYRALGQQIAVEVFAIEMRRFCRVDPKGFAELIAPLRGRNLACWCRPDAPCHADVLIEMANAVPSDA